MTNTNKRIPNPPQGLTASKADPTFAVGPIERSSKHGRVQAWRVCSEFIDGRWESFVSIEKVRN